MPLFPVLLPSPRSPSLKNPGSGLVLDLKSQSAPLHPTMSNGPWSPSNHDIQLENRFDIFKLHDFPPLAGESRALPPSPLPLRGSHSSLSPLIAPPAIPGRCLRPRAHRSIPHFTPTPQRHPAPLSVHPSSPTQSSQVQFSPLTTPPPTMLIVGDSIIRHIKSKSAVTHCLPGAKAVDVLLQIPSLVSKHRHVD